MEKINCPICQSKKINFFCKKNGFKLYNCLPCGLGFVWPTPSKLVDIYQAPYFKGSFDDSKVDKFGYTDYEEDKKAMRKTFIAYLDKISELTAGRKIFDVGAATGYFLDLAKARGWQTAGIEISEYAAKIAGAKGHKIFTGNLADLEINEKYDAVAMFDVLEHLAEPQKYLLAVSGILNQGGVLAINTIDRSSFYAKLMGKNWHAIVPPEHLFYYSTESLSTLLKTAGFEVLLRLKIGKKFTLPYIFKVMANSYNFKILIKLADIFGKGCWKKIYLPVNLRDNIFIIAKKI